MNTFRVYITVALVCASTSYGSKNDKDKNCPTKTEVQKALEKAGKPHVGERIKVREVGSVRVDLEPEKTYFHVFNVYVKDRDEDIEEYRAVIFDNKKAYLGYYPTYDLEVSDVEDSAFIIELDTGDDGDVDEDGNNDSASDSDMDVVEIPIDGPAKAVTINGSSVRFIEAPKPEVKAEEAVASDEANLAKYRDWTISSYGKPVTVQALFIRVEGDQVFLKGAAKGIVKGFKLYTLSEADKKYVKSQMDK